MGVRYAQLEDRRAINRIARQSPYTKGAIGQMFMPEIAFHRGEVLVARSRHGQVVGFTAIRHLSQKSKPWTSLHYVGIDEDWRGRGIGEALVRRVLAESPHGCVRLKCEVENKRAHRFYKRMGFKRIGKGANRAGVPYYEYELKEES